MEEVTSSSFRTCWDEPEYPGSPYLAGYEITYDDKKERIDVIDCFKFGSDRLEWRQSHILSIAVSAVSGSGNEIVAQSSSSKLILLMGKKKFFFYCVVYI